MAPKSTKTDASPMRAPKRFRTIQGVRRFVAIVLTRLWEDDGLETDRARVMLYGAKVLADLIEGGEMERRVSALESKRQEELRHDA